MEKISTVKERIDTFILKLLDNGFEEWHEEEVDLYRCFYLCTPLDVRIFEKDVIMILISENSNSAEIYMDETQLLGKRNFTDFVYG